MKRTAAGMRVLVTGAAGFIGANTVRRLVRDGAEVHALVRPGHDLARIAEIRNKIELHQADLLIQRSVSRTLAGIEFDAVCHCAGVRATPTRPISLRDGVEREAKMALNLFAALAPSTSPRIVCVTTSYEYGPKNRPHRESDPVAPANARGLSKSVASLLLQSLARMNQREFVRLCLFSVYGPWQQESRLVPQALRAALTGGALALTSLPTFRDLIFVDDAVAGIARAIVEPRAANQTFNFGSGRMTTNHAVVHEIEKLTNRRVHAADSAHPFTEADLGPWVADITKARKMLGWQPRYSLRQGLRLTMDWYAQQLESVDSRIIGQKQRASTR